MLQFWVAEKKKLYFVQEWTGHSRFIRVMPNTPSAVGEAATGMLSHISL